MALVPKKLADCKITLDQTGSDRYRVNFTDGARDVYSIDVTYNDGRLSFHHEDLSTTVLVDSKLIPDGRIADEKQEERILAAIENSRGVFRGTVEKPAGGEVPIVLRLRHGGTTLADGAIASIQGMKSFAVPLGASIVNVNGERWHYRLTGEYAGEPYNVEIERPVTAFDE